MRSAQTVGHSHSERPADTTRQLLAVRLRPQRAEVCRRPRPEWPSPRNENVSSKLPGSVGGKRCAKELSPLLAPKNYSDFCCFFQHSFSMVLSCAHDVISLLHLFRRPWSGKQRSLSHHRPPGRPRDVLVMSVKTLSRFARPPLSPTRKHISTPSTIKPNSCPCLDGHRIGVQEVRPTKERPGGHVRPNQEREKLSKFHPHTEKMMARKDTSIYP